MVLTRKTKAERLGPIARMRRWVRRMIRKAVIVMMLSVALVVGLYAVVPPPYTHTMWVERRAFGAIEKQWVPLDQIAPAMRRAAIAAEDANFCRHWGFDMTAIRAAIAEGGRRGGSTITQQTVKNAYLWQERSYVRKALEAVLTPAVEAVWSKRRILEVYLNIAEFGPGIFGVQAAAQYWYGTDAAELTPAQAARLATLLPSPKTRNPNQLSPSLQGRAASIADGAATIARDGRDECVLTQGAG